MEGRCTERDMYLRGSDRIAVREEMEREAREEKKQSRDDVDPYTHGYYLTRGGGWFDHLL